MPHSEQYQAAPKWQCRRIHYPIKQKTNINIPFGNICALLHFYLWLIFLSRHVFFSSSSYSFYFQRLMRERGLVHREAVGVPLRPPHPHVCAVCPRIPGGKAVGGLAWSADTSLAAAKYMQLHKKSEA